MTTIQPKDFDIFEKIKNIVYCPECKEDPPNIGEEYADGHLVCLSCGLVCGEGIVDTRPEWRTFSNDEKPGTDRNRVGDGGDPLLSGDQLHTMISGGKSASAVIALSRTQQKSTKDKPNEKMIEIFRDIDAFCAFGKLNSVVVEASKHVGKLAVEGKWFQSFNDQVICAIIFEGCKRAGDSRNMKEIARLSGKNIAFNKQLAMINKKLTSGGSQGDASVNTGASRATFAKDLMPRYCQQIGLPVWAETLAVQVAEAVSDTLILGARTARNIAASVIYLVCHLIGHPRTVTDIYPLAEQAKATVQKSIRIIFEEREQVLKSPYWPTDKRIDCDLFKNLLNSRWYSQGPSEGGLKRKLESQGIEPPHKKVKSTIVEDSQGPPKDGLKQQLGLQEIESPHKRLKSTTLEDSQRPLEGGLKRKSEFQETEPPHKKLKSTTPESDSMTSNQDSDNQGTSNSVSSLSSRSILVPKLSKKPQTNTLNSSLTAQTTNTPTKKPDKASGRPIGAKKYGFPPAKEQKVFIWNGLYLPGPM